MEKRIPKVEKQEQGEKEIKDFYPSNDDKNIMNIPDIQKEHLKAHSDVIKYLPEILTEKLKYSENGSFINEQIYFPEKIGFSGAVDTKEIDLDEEVWFAQRSGGRAGPTRVTIEYDPVEVDMVTVIALKDKIKSENSDKNNWKLLTAYIGEAAEREPWSEFRDRENRIDFKSLEDSVEFWTRRAMTYNEDDFNEPFKSTLRRVIMEQAKDDEYKKAIENLDINKIRKEKKN